MGAELSPQRGPCWHPHLSMTCTLTWPVRCSCPGLPTPLRPPSRLFPQHQPVDVPRIALLSGVPVLTVPSAGNPWRSISQSWSLGCPVDLISHSRFHLEAPHEYVGDPSAHGSSLAQNGNPESGPCVLSVPCIVACLLSRRCPDSLAMLTGADWPDPGPCVKWC